MNIFKLENQIQNYVWGSITAIPELLGISNEKKIPMAELWMGAHYKAPSLVYTKSGSISLSEIISDNPEKLLGRKSVERFGLELPFLFKVLAAGKPLSIQAHPNKNQAEKGFEKDNLDGIALDAVNRNYRDSNHKPEVMCALTPFTALSGFRPLEEIISNFFNLNSNLIKAELYQFRKNRTISGLKAFFSALMYLSGEKKELLISDALNFFTNHNDDIGKWVIRLGEDYPDDIGILAPLFLNLITLNPGEAVYLGAGELHAYLDGLGIELMANSDNVLRGGLTVKHIDVNELLKTLTFRHCAVELIKPQKSADCELVYPSPADEFRLSEIQITDSCSFLSENRQSIEIYICTGGELSIYPGNNLSIKKGESFLVYADTGAFEIKGNGTLYRADVPF